MSRPSDAEVISVLWDTHRCLDLMGESERAGECQLSIEQLAARLEANPDLLAPLTATDCEWAAEALDLDREINCQEPTCKIWKAAECLIGIFKAAAAQRAQEELK